MPLHFTHVPFQGVLHMFHLQRAGPTVAGGIDRAKKLQLIKNTGKLSVNDKITSWYLQFTESYKFACLKRDIQHVLTHMLTQSSCKLLKKPPYKFYPSEMVHILHPQIN